jgi:hypothetical protein
VVVSVTHPRPLVHRLAYRTQLAVQLPRPPLHNTLPQLNGGTPSPHAGRGCSTATHLRRAQREHERGGVGEVARACSPVTALGREGRREAHAHTTLVSSCTLLQELHLRPDSACSRGKLEPFALGCRVRGELCTEVAHTHRYWAGTCWYALSTTPPHYCAAVGCSSNCGCSTKPASPDPASHSAPIPVPYHTSHPSAPSALLKRAWHTRTRQEQNQHERQLRPRFDCS